MCVWVVLDLDGDDEYFEKVLRIVNNKLSKRNKK